MTLDEALYYIHSVCWKGSVPGLERISALLDKMGHPERKLKFIHVTGTNGKGSTCAMLASMFTKAGYKTGLYTSPYLIRFNERIQIDGVQYLIPGTDAGTVVDVFTEEEAIAVFLHGQCITQLNRTADAYQASTFKHRQKEIWEPGNVQSSGLDRSLREYDRFIEENSHGRC